MNTTKITSTEKEITSDSARTSIAFHGSVTIHVGSPWRSHHMRRDTPIGCAYGQLAVLRRIADTLQRLPEPPESPFVGRHSHPHDSEHSRKCHLKTRIFDRVRVGQQHDECGSRNRVR